MMAGSLSFDDLLLVDMSVVSRIHDNEGQSAPQGV